MRHDVYTLVFLIISIALVGLCHTGCASSSNAKQDQMSAAETSDQVMYAPPADAEPVSVPPGAPLLDEYKQGVAAKSESPAVMEESRDTESALEVTRQQLDSLLEKGPGWGLIHVRVLAAKDEQGRLVGYQVEQMSEGAHVWLHPSLQVGDQITHLNGVRIQTPDDYMEAWNLSRGAESLRIDFIRGGEAVSVNWLVID